jgi:hypothetical protein
MTFITNRTLFYLRFSNPSAAILKLENMIGGFRLELIVVLPDMVDKMMYQHA